MNKNLSIELINKLGQFKKENDPEDEMSVLECLTEFASKEGKSMDEYIDILADNPAFKIILKEDLTNRGLLYMDGYRVTNKDQLQDW